MATTPAKLVALPARGGKIAAESPPSPPRSEKVGNSVRISKPIAPAPVPIPVAEEAPRRVKSPLGAKELKEFKDLLLRKRAEIVGDASHLAENMNHRSGAGASEHSSMPIHMADLGSDNWEQELNLGLLASEQENVREIDNALRRIQEGTYGICLATQKPIGLARLRAKPWARYCIEYARAREEGRA